MNTIGGAHLIVGGTIGKASAKTDCVKGKSYEADYFVLSAGLVGGLEFDASKIFNLVSKNITSSYLGKSFTLPANYPESYISYLDIEGHAASAGWGVTFGDAEISTYQGGRGDVKPWSTGYTGEVGVQLFKFSGVHLIRYGKVRENKCCGN